MPARHTARRWHKEIQRASKTEKGWRQDGRHNVKIYRDELHLHNVTRDTLNHDHGKQEFNIFFSNVQTIKPAVFSSTPRPDVRRRYKDDNPLGKEVSEVLERALTFAIDRYDFDQGMSKAVDDMLIPGRGVLRVRYEPVFEEEEQQLVVQKPNEFGEIEEVVEVTSDERLVSEDVMCEYVYWEDLRLEPKRNWEDLDWIGFRHKFDKDGFAEEFGEEAMEGVDFSFEFDDTEDTELKKTDKKQENGLAIVWEIWHKPDRKVVWLAQGKNRILEVEEDPLGLEGFFPIPKPLYAIETTDTLVPMGELQTYEKLDKELNIVQGRIRLLTEGLKLRGIYPKSMTEIENLLQLNDNKMLGVENFDVFQSTQGLDKFISYAPITEVAQVIVNLREQREAIKQTIFEVTGISDIVRGATKASETATAQRIKSTFGTLRLDERRSAVAVFARDLLRLKAEVIAENFERETLEAITGLQVNDQMMAIMRDDLLRAYNIDIETDSTVSIDKSEEKQDVRELLEGIVAYLNGIAPFVQSPGNPQGLIPLDTAKDILLWSMRSFRGSRAIEDAIERIGQSPIGGPLTGGINEFGTIQENAAGAPSPDGVLPGQLGGLPIAGNGTGNIQ